MRHRPIQAAPRERVPFTLWGHKRVRQALATVAAAAVALVPVTFVASPAYAADIANLTISNGANWEGGKVSFTVTYTGAASSGAITFTTDDTDQAVAATNGGTDFTTAPSIATYTFPGTTAGGVNTITVTVDTTKESPSVDDPGDETFRLLATNAGGDTLAGIGTIWDDHGGTYTLTGATTYPETAITTGTGAGAVTTQRTARITAQLNSAVTHDVVIPVESVAGTALSTGGEFRDYTAIPANTSITIPANQVTGYVDVTLWDDTVDESATQQFSVRQTGTALGTRALTDIAAQTVVVKITDDDLAPTVSIGTPLPATEGTPLSFPIVLSNPSEQAITVDFVAADGTNSATSQGAVAADYTATSRLLANSNAVSIPSYNKTVAVGVPTVDDALVEGPENLKGTISNPVNTSLGSPTSATGIIEDSEAGPTVALTGTTNATFSETDADHNEVVTVTLSAASTIPVKLDYKFNGGTATNGVDYKASDGSLTIAAGQTTATIPITIVGDAKYEGGGETIKVDLTSPNNSVSAATVTPQTLTITDSGALGNGTDGQPKWTVGDVTVDEGNSGTVMARVPVTLTAANNVDTTFNVSLGDDSAVNAGTNSATTPGVNDYDTPLDTTVTVKAGELVGYLEVPVNGDTVYEQDERFLATVTQTSGGIDNTVPTNGQHASKVTIKGDDAKPTVTFNATSGSEGTTLRVTPTAVGMSQYAYTVGLDFATSGTGIAAATPVLDYEAPTTQQTFTVTAGSTGVLNSLITNVYLIPDDIDEAAESFSATATEVSASPTGFTTATGIYKINDDPGDLPPAATIRDESIGEWESSVDVHVDLSQNGDATSSTQTVMIPWKTVDGSAKAGEDYVAASGVLEIAPGTKTAMVNVKVLNDTMVEQNEVFWVKLDTPGPQGATLVKANSEVTVKSDDTVQPVKPTLMADGPDQGAGKVTFKGMATPGSSVQLWGAALPTVDVKKFKVLATVEADSEGRYVFAARSISAGWAYAVTAYDMVSPVQIVKITQAPELMLSTTKGKLTASVWGDPKASGQSATVQWWNSKTKKWTTLDSGKTAANGIYKDSWTMKSGTKLKIRASIAGSTSTGIITGWSDEKRITIK